MEPLKIAVLHIRDTREHNPGFQLELDELNTNTLTQIHQTGHLPELISSWQLSLEQLQQIVDRSDAVIIMGGEDVDPQLYNGPLSYPGSGSHEPQADRTQIAAIHHAIATDTPLLGICRGLQLINVALGGTLIQDLDPALAHRGEGTDPFAQTHVSVVDDELAVDLSALSAHQCTHHQAIDSLGDGLQIVARSADGVIEAVVHHTAKLTGVQWHPEHSQTADTQLGPLIQRLARQLGHHAPAPRNTAENQLVDA
ncbi:gamma-glutamyl-gamma-aminobutyrate hydrolase family protein [Glutamicibacter sp. NPDC087344]|uniref:gamma-glutamyl-gamma-aminobutyrate hydrolase family protein n=1 Tax=Glutamicibacter sp. NPDC087344 TaxID=3363994 RepID=UPI00381EE9B6